MISVDYTFFKQVLIVCGEVQYLMESNFPNLLYFKYTVLHAYKLGKYVIK